MVGFGVGSVLDHVGRDDDDDDAWRTPPRTGTAFRKAPADSAAAAASSFSAQADEFTICICVLIAGVMKSDGLLQPEEFALVSRRLKENHHFDDVGCQRMLGFIRELAQGNWEVEEFARRAKRHLPKNARRNLLFFLLEIAYANGEYIFAEQQVIFSIGEIFGLGDREIAAMEAALSRRGSEWAYQTLEISREATEAEIRKAYRRLAMLHHPDKVAGQGEVAVAAATRKFQAIRTAYEEIKRERNFN